MVWKQGIRHVRRRTARSSSTEKGDKRKEGRQGGGTVSLIMDSLSLFLLDGLSLPMAYGWHVISVHVHIRARERYTRAY